MRQAPLLSLALALSLTYACSQSSRLPLVEVEAEARAFMEGYARDLINHDAGAIAARYDRSGAYFVGSGRKELEPFEALKERYLETWEGPLSFEWRDLSYEVLSSDSVLVFGLFSWENSSETMTFSYTGLLKRQDDQLRIRLEDESVDPQAIIDYICADNETQP